MMWRGDVCEWYSQNITHIMHNTLKHLRIVLYLNYNLTTRKLLFLRVNHNVLSLFN